MAVAFDMTLITVAYGIIQGCRIQHDVQQLLAA